MYILAATGWVLKRKHSLIAQCSWGAFTSNKIQSIQASFLSNLAYTNSLRDLFSHCKTSPGDVQLDSCVLQTFKDSTVYVVEQIFGVWSVAQNPPPYWSLQWGQERGKGTHTVISLSTELLSCLYFYGQRWRRQKTALYMLKQRSGEEIFDFSPLQVRIIRIKIDHRSYLMW